MKIGQLFAEHEKQSSERQKGENENVLLDLTNMPLEYRYGQIVHIDAASLIVHGLAVGNIGFSFTAAVH